MTQDPGSLELMIGALFGALVLVAIVWAPLYAIVFRAERQHAAEQTAVASPPLAMTQHERVQWGERVEADMHELGAYLDPAARMSRPGFRAAEPPALGHMRSALPTLSLAATAFLPAGSAALAAFGSAEPSHVGGEIFC